jgi:hypothetical protein
MDIIDRIRIEEFRQLKKEIRGSERFLIIGIDVAKDKHVPFPAISYAMQLMTNIHTK